MECPYCGCPQVTCTDEDTDDFGVSRISYMQCDDCGAHYAIFSDDDDEEFIVSGGWTSPDYQG
jgi:hypothetical protein